jgi:hypothetical protein
MATPDRQYVVDGELYLGAYFPDMHTVSHTTVYTQYGSRRLAGVERPRTAAGGTIFHRWLTIRGWGTEWPYKVEALNGRARIRIYVESDFTGSMQGMKCRTHTQWT